MADSEFMPGGVRVVAAGPALKGGQVWLSAEQKDLVLAALAYWRETLNPPTSTGAAAYVVRRIDAVAGILDPASLTKEVPDA